MTLPLFPEAALRQITTVVSHVNCPDGIASAILVKDVLPCAVVRYVGYGTPEMDALKAEPGMLFVDFSPPPERAREFVDAGALVLDHHPTAKEVVEMFGERGLYSNGPGCCGATMAFDQVWRPLGGMGGPIHDRAADFAMLAGIRDTWLRKHDRFREALAQGEMLRFFDDWDEYRDIFCGHDVMMKQRVRVGRQVLRNKEEAAKRAIAKGWRFAVANVRSDCYQVIALEGTHLTSDVAEALDGQGVDLVVGFGHEMRGDVAMLNLSLRSHTTFDCAHLAQRHGGGGHLRAAGCRVPLADDDNVYDQIFTLLEQS